MQLPFYLSSIFDDIHVHGNVDRSCLIIRSSLLSISFLFVVVEKQIFMVLSHPLDPSLRTALTRGKLCCDVDLPSKPRSIQMIYAQTKCTMWDVCVSL